jgi:hypothetical protein
MTDDHRRCRHAGPRGLGGGCRRPRPAGFAGQEFATQDRPETERLEEVAAHHQAADRTTAVRQDEKVERPAIERRRLDGSYG